MPAQDAADGMLGCFISLY